MLIRNNYSIHNNNFSIYKNHSTINNNSSLSNKNYSTNFSTKYKNKSNSYSPLNNLPSIYQNSNIVTKIKNASLKKSISYLYKLLFPEQKKSMDEFLNNFSYNKFLNRPNWKYTFYPYKDEDKIKQYLMFNNDIMRSYNNMKIPTKLKKQHKKKPRMVQILEENYVYKNQDYNNILDEKNNNLNKNNNNSSNKEGDKSNEKKGEKKKDGEKNTSIRLLYDNINNINNNSIKNKNKTNFGNIYRGNLSPLKKNKYFLSNIPNIKKINYDIKGQLY